MKPISSNQILKYISEIKIITKNTISTQIVFVFFHAISKLVVYPNEAVEKQMGKCLLPVQKINSIPFNI